VNESVVCRVVIVEYRLYIIWFKCCWLFVCFVYLLAYCLNLCGVVMGWIWETWFSSMKQIL